MTDGGNGANGADAPGWLKNGKMLADFEIQRQAQRQAAARAGISSKLREVYAQVVSEPLPPCFAFLLDQLDQVPPKLGDT